MIRQRIYLEKEKWEVTVYYAVTHYEVEEIMSELARIGCTGKNLESAYENIASGVPNTGLCYSGDGQSVLVISVAVSASQFCNSMFHEIHHLSSHIADKLGYDLIGEEVCYLSGEIAEEMFHVAKKFLCEHCREGIHL